jgi:hypothetical protein
MQFAPAGNIPTHNRTNYYDTLSRDYSTFNVDNVIQCRRILRICCAPFPDNMGTLNYSSKIFKALSVRSTRRRSVIDLYATDYTPKKLRRIYEPLICLPTDHFGTLNFSNSLSRNRLKDSEFMENFACSRREIMSIAS